jgi:pyrimidine precursor biosynthesis enzyme
MGFGKVDMGFKDMIHTLGAKARGVPVAPISSLLGKPLTDLVYLGDVGLRLISGV